MSAPTLLEQQKNYFFSGLNVGLATGSCGIVGGSIAAIVKHNPRIATYAIGTGLNCFLLGTTYSDAASDRHKIQISAIAGGITGATGGIVLRGRANIIPGAIMFTLFGLTGQFIYNKLDARHINSTLEDMKTTPDQRSKAKERSMMERILRSDSSPVKRLSDDEYKALLRKQILVIDVDIAIVDDEIASLRRSKESG